jgi:hypothetical protein
LHFAIPGTPYRQKWEAILLENCRRFAAGQPLLNVVDKENGIDCSTQSSPRLELSALCETWARQRHRGFARRAENAGDCDGS